MTYEDDDRAIASDSSERDEEGWQDADADAEKLVFVSLLDDALFDNMDDMLQHCKSVYSFDFTSILKQHNLDFYMSIKLVNYIRLEVESGNKLPDVSSLALFAGDEYLRPTLDDDAVLFSLGDLVGAQGELIVPVASSDRRDVRIAELESELAALRSQFSQFRDQVDRTLEARWTDAAAIQGATPELACSYAARDGDKDYFESYSYNEIHETMLKDSVRTDAYRDFIYGNKHLFAGKTVLDVGCGTGILSMFCAKAGAANVVAVDNSAIIYKAMANISVNGLNGQITCIRGRIEEIELPVKQVDIIVSEWMGYCLLYEAMLDSVIWARDHYLKPDGLMVPSHCILYITPVSDENLVMDQVQFWRDVYGFDMSPMKDEVFHDVLIRHMPEASLAGTSQPFATLDLHKVRVEDLVFTADFRVKLSRAVVSLDAWLLHFDTFFMLSREEGLPARASAKKFKDLKNCVAFTTGPYGRETHWKSGVLLNEGSSKVASGCLTEGHEVTGTIEYRKARSDKRGLEICLKWQDEPGAVSTQTWHLM